MPKKSDQKSTRGRSSRDGKGESQKRAIILSDYPTLKSIDEIDRKIIDQLRKDGRTPMRELASLTGLTEATVRSRMRRLEENETLHVTATVNLEKVGQHYFAPLGLTVRGRPVENVAEDLTKIPEIVTLMTVMGDSDIELLVLTQTVEDLTQVILHTIPAVRGVAKVDASLAVDVPKYDAYWMPFK